MHSRAGTVQIFTTPDRSPCFDATRSPAGDQKSSETRAFSSELQSTIFRHFSELVFTPWNGPRLYANIMAVGEHNIASEYGERTLPAVFPINRIGLLVFPTNGPAKRLVPSSKQRSRNIEQTLESFGRKYSPTTTIQNQVMVCVK